VESPILFRSTRTNFSEVIYILGRVANYICAGNV
jgi:hypothetical protein